MPVRMGVDREGSPERMGVDGEPMPVILGFFFSPSHFFFWSVQATIFCDFSAYEQG